MDIEQYDNKIITATKISLLHHYLKYIEDDTIDQDGLIEVEIEEKF